MILIDIIIDNSLDSVFEVTIKPIAHIIYYYVNTNSATVPTKSTLNDAVSYNIDYLRFSNSSITEAVIPIIRTNPASSTIVCFSNGMSYDVSDISFASNLYNVNSLNEGDAGYNGQDDYGYFLTGSTYNYTASRRIDGNRQEGLHQIGSSILSAGLGYIPYVGNALTIIGTTIDVVQGVAMITDTYEYDENNTSYDVTNFLSTKATQLFEYGRLIKAANMRINSSGENRLYFCVGDEAKGTFGLSHGDRYLDEGEEIPLIEYSNLRLQVGLKIIDLSDNSVQAFLNESIDYDVVYSSVVNENTFSVVSTGDYQAEITGLAQTTPLVGKVNIPSTVEIEGNTYSVTSIGESAFAGQTALTNVYLPGSIARIDALAFENCTNLQRVSLTSEYNQVNVPDQTRSFQNGYYDGDYCLDLTLLPNVTYTLTFDYDNLTSSSGDVSDVFTTVGVGDGEYQNELPMRQYYSNTSGTQTFVFTPMESDVEQWNRLWCNFIRTDTQETVSVNISNVKLEVGVTWISTSAFDNCPKLGSSKLTYTLLSDNTYSVSNGGEDSRVLFVPGSYKGKTVSEIATSGFASQNYKMIVLQEGISKIGSSAFANNESIEMLTIPNSVASIESGAFQNCTSLSTLTFATSGQLTDIKNSAFANCHSLLMVTIPTSVINIGSYAFQNCIEMTSFLFAANSNVSTIGSYALAGCRSITGITIQDSVTSIGANAFQNCYALGSVTFDAGSAVTRIENATFTGCSNLTNINLPAGITYIGSNAFYSASSLNSIIITSSVSTIGANAFQNCSKLTIYVGGSTPNNGWASGWNSSSRPVLWNCGLSSTNPKYVVSITNTTVNISNQSAAGGISNPYRKGYTFGGWYTTSDFSGTKYDNVAGAPTGGLFAKWEESSCLAEGTLITLADGTQVAVEDLTGNEMLLVWNMHTGQFDSAPILFIDSDGYREYEIIHLYFSDGTEVKVIDEHAFWDVDLNRYVFLRDDATRYIGHYFNKQTLDEDGNMTWTTVQLVNVVIHNEYTTAWSPVTYGHLCLYVNGMLSMPGATEGLINIFDVNGTTMQYDSESFAQDIAEYGLFTYEEFYELIPISQEVFNAFGGQYLKVSIGKGLTTIEDIEALVARYSEFF